LIVGLRGLDIIVAKKGLKTINSNSNTKKSFEKGVDREFIKHEIVPSELFRFIKKNKFSYFIKKPVGMRRNGSRPLPTFLGCGRFDIPQKNINPKKC
jgi:hypothetical protein